ncbi:MAG: hypothetical protein JHC61_11685 [Burkholderiaceae bacterium]|nr:hypothetical protein [Burkholderiaceae bacterium]
MGVDGGGQGVVVVAFMGVAQPRGRRRSACLASVTSIVFATLIQIVLAHEVIRTIEADPGSSGPCA